MTEPAVQNSEPGRVDRVIDAALGDEVVRRRVLSTFRLGAALSLFMAGVIVALLGLVIALVSHIFGELGPSLRADLEWKARRGASELVQAAEYSILLRDQAQLELVLKSHSDPDILARAVADGEGTPIHTEGTLPVPPARLFEGAPGVLHEGPDCLYSWAESRIEGNVAGRAAVVVSTRRLEAGTRLKREILVVAGFGGLLALLATFGFVGLYVSPLIRVTRGAFERLETATHAAFEAARAKGEFIANVSHEIRTPMNGVLGMIELLFGSELGEKHARRVATLRASAKALMNVLDDVLDFSKVEAGKMELRPRAVDPARLLRETVELFQAQAELKHVTLALDIGPGPLPLVSIDADRLKQVLSNLIGNALKFTEVGSVTAGLTVTAADEEALLLRIAVADTGVGIPSQALPSVFEAFKQVDGSATRRYGGTGLGLAISRRIVLLMGGTLTATSSEGRGSVFEIELPCPLAPASALSDGSQPGGALLAGSFAGAGRVLVAEDNPVNRIVIGEFLKELACDADLVDNGEQVLEAVAHRSYDLVLMDCQMPVLDGYAATRRLRANEATRRLPVIAVTAHAFDDERARTREAGMDDFLSKPVSLEALAGVLERYLGRTDSDDTRI